MTTLAAFALFVFTRQRDLVARCIIKMCTADEGFISRFGAFSHAKGIEVGFLSKPNEAI